jgi:hypothetical protein
MEHVCLTLSMCTCNTLHAKLFTKLFSQTGMTVLTQLWNIDGAFYAPILIKA